MNKRGISGKWKHMWHSSPSPKYDDRSSGHWFASARKMRSGNSASSAARSTLITPCVSGRFSLLVPSRSHRYGTASSRKPSTPTLHQKRIAPTIAPITTGFWKFKSGWCEKKRCQKYCPATGSHAQFDVSVSVKMMRVPAYLRSSSDHT